jgi:hypothetical protein
VRSSVLLLFLFCREFGVLSILADMSLEEVMVLGKSGRV